MAIYKKKNLLEILSTLEKANDSIKIVKQNELPEMINILTQCQELAVGIGCDLEARGKSGQEIIKVLEDYCEKLYQQSIALSDEILCRKLGKRIRNQLTKVKNMIRYELPDDKKEIVFLPYKASMWDSLESVWLAAQEDENCDVYVVPIPYYDRNSDGSFGQLHYEGDEYPQYVPITSWDSFNLLDRRPDVIYIHNPYDGWNSVTSIHPDFYSEKLCRYTEKLVYIPYFILAEIEPTAQDIIESIKHFCFLPGTIYAHKVIVQSEEMRQIYIREYIKAARKNGLNVDKVQVEEKFLGIGSPKSDKVMNTKTEDLDIPAAWLNIIRKPDGSWKKIIFYNTSIAALLANNEKMIKKIEDTLCAFKEKQDEMVLLWRPHPLLGNTIKSMRPQLWERYEAVVDTYKKEAWGIFDDTADMNRAIELSDAYYGDESSVVQLCLKAGKQILIQDVYWKNNITHSICSTEAIIEIGEEYWFVPYWEKALYRMNKWNFQFQKVIEIEEERCEGLYLGIIQYKNKLYLIPKTADRIAVYNITDESIRYLNFRNNKKSNPVNSSFFDYQIIKEHLYLIPCKYSEIVQVNMNNEVIEIVRISEKEEIVCAGSAAILENYIFVPDMAGDCLIKFNMENKSVEKIFPNNEHIKYTHIFNSNERLLLIPDNVNDGVRVWDVRNNIFEEVYSFPDEILETQIHSSLRHGIKVGNDIFLLATGDRKNIVIHIEEKKMETWCISPKYDKWLEEEWRALWRHMALFYASDKLYTICGISGEWFQYQSGEWKILTEKSKYIDDTALRLDNKILYFHAPLNKNQCICCGKQIYEVTKEDK